MSENCVKPVRHYSVRKREAREFHGSGLISNHEEYEESKIESQTLHYTAVFFAKFVVQLF